MRLRGFAAAAIILMSVSTRATAETDDAVTRLAAAQEMFHASQRDQIEAVRIDLIVERAASQLKAALPNTSDANLQLYRSALREELVKEDAPLMQLRAQYYADHFTLAELREWTKLIQSDIGQKILAAEPNMMRDLYNVDYQWVADAMRRAAERINGGHDGAKPL